MQTKDIHNNILSFMREASYAPMTAEELLAVVKAENSVDKFWQVLLEMEENGEIIKTRFETYGLPEKMGLIAGRLQLTSKGFGFVIPDNKKENPDVFIAPRSLNGAMNNDRVLARVNYNVHGKRPEGEILRIITHANNKVVGIFCRTGSYAFVTPDDKRIGQDIYVMKKDFNGAKNGQKVVVEITTWPEENRKAEGIIKEVLGNIGDVGLEILSIIKQNDLPLEFPARVLAASRKVPKSISKEELNGRRDLRFRSIVTIDGEDAKDLDDAVYAERVGSDFLLGVYIADVSYYVTEDSVLDLEARERSTSVYLVDRVLPMLPERLSNGICSLNAGEDRLVLSCEMHIDNKGRVLRYEIFPAVINVRHRLSYNIVRGMLAGDEELCNKYADIMTMVGVMDELREILHSKRAARGAVDFAMSEQKVILDENLKPIEIQPRVHGNAESIIEEFMLAANETVAKHMSERQWPFVYRVHGIPAEDKLLNLAKLLANFNIRLHVVEKTQPKEIQKALKAMVGRPEEKLVSTIALRSMRQAVYQTENIGHFGLAAQYYTHFTSPIRRYPDLIVHRLVRKWMVKPKLSGNEAEALKEKLAVIAQHASIKERIADDAERATVDLKMCEYMAGHIGEEYEGTISGVTAFGMFVELENGVEGLVHISSLMDDYYDFYEDRYALVGTHTGHTYRMGDRVRIEVLRVNISDVSIDFIMAGENNAVREHIRQQLMSRQKHTSASARQRLPFTADSNRKKRTKGTKRKQTSHRSAKRGKSAARKKRKKK